MPNFTQPAPTRALSQEVPDAAPHSAAQSSERAADSAASPNQATANEVASTPTPSLREVYEAHFGFVWRSIRRLGVREEEAEDAAQEVFLVVHRKLATFRHESKITTWLFGICIRVASDRQKRAYQRREVATDAAFFGQLAGGSTAKKSEAGLTLDLLVQGLPPEQCVVLKMFEVEEFSCAEIAAELGIPEGTVKSRLRLAREFLAKRLEAAFGEKVVFDE
jgi:RNA polymerase sigma-70 factor (ECF subfamily)